MQIPLFEGEVHLCRTREEWDAAMARFRGDQFASPRAAGMCFPFSSAADGAVYLVGVFDRSIATLAHEALHAVVFILKEAGVPVSSENDEVMAYLLAHLMRELLPLFGAATHARNARG
ncbi:hypothetical protein [Burkholderia ubonensis]|uniref:hypothetical protein n=1 Tax=Burkholderia ubonensis TaxID=101571 RepID=UPI00076BE22F|nr:hypothetical protein [Burkholderia ubonensis]KVO11730.1 hypothetical protein WJ73_19470 [Burkholderia ubonensis]